MPRRAEDCHYITGLHDAAGVHHNYAIRGLTDKPKIVRGEQSRGVRLPLNMLQNIDDLRLDGDVEGRSRFIGDEKRGAVRNGDGNHDSLTHTSRQFVRVSVVAQAWLRDSDLMQQL